MHRRTTRGNRIGLTIVGALLLLAGAAVIVLHLGLFGSNADAPIYPAGESHWLADHRYAYWLVPAAAIVVAVLALRWLLVQFRTDRVRRLVMDTEHNDERGSGTTSLAGADIARAIRDDILAITGVRSADVSLTGPRDAPDLWVTVTVNRDTDTGNLRSRLVNQVLADARSALETPEMDVYLTVNVNNRTIGRQVA